MNIHYAHSDYMEPMFKFGYTEKKQVFSKSELMEICTEEGLAKAMGLRRDCDGYAQPLCFIIDPTPDKFDTYEVTAKQGNPNPSKVRRLLVKKRRELVERYSKARYHRREWKMMNCCKAKL